MGILAHPGNHKLKKNYFDEHVFSVQERPFFTLSRTLYTFSFKKKLFALIKSTQWNNLRFSPSACTRIINSKNCKRQGLQVRAFQQRYLKCKCETPCFEGELAPKTCKNLKMSSKKKFLSGLVTKPENLFVFGTNLWKISSNWWFQKSCWPISVWLEYLKSVLC